MSAWPSPLKSFFFFNGGKLDTNNVSGEATVVRAWVPLNGGPQ
jgi:hypothetical protein